MIIQKRSFAPLLVGVVVLASFISQVLLPSSAFAAQITTRSLTLQAGATDGGSKPGGVVKHKYDFTVPTNASVGSIKFEYCTLAAGTCTTPTGLVTTSATLDAQNNATGFTMVNTTNGAPYLTRTAASIAGPLALSYTLGSVTNPTATNYTFFVRISTYTASNTTGTAIDTGNVTAATATQIILSGTMPESLVFCAGKAIGLTALVPDCSTVTTGLVDFDQLFSPVDTSTAQSQLAASTNAGGGYAISVNGPTLTSGSNTVSQMSAAAVTARGVSQFGMNLKANTLTTATQLTGFGLEVATASNGTNYRGQATTGYNTVDNFKFTTGDIVADSSNGGAGGSDAQIFTVSYVVNVPGSQPAGTYTTTLTYICTPTF
ncbi:MAG: hypothetical protein ABIP50_01100 [Candidatus Saccharimonadales bacterium]